MQQLSAQDALFLYLETAKMPMHIGGVYIFDSKDKPFVFNEIKTYLAERLHLSRIFRQRLIEVPLNLGQPYWVDDPDFDLDYHLCHVALPKPGGRRELVELAAQIYNPHGTLTPNGEINFCDGLRKHGRIQRKCLCDGGSGTPCHD